MKSQESIPLGVVLKRQRIGHKWQEYAWRVDEVVPGAPDVTDWRLLRQDAVETAYLAATLPLVLHPSETAGYRHNLSQRQPVVYVVLRHDESCDERPLRPFCVTVCPTEAQDYQDGDDLVEAVPMPSAIVDWLHDYVRRFHVDKPFEKRGRRARDAQRGAGGRGDA